MKKKMKELVSKLNEAARVYYNEDREIMSNYEYDALFDELQRLEEETGTILKDSPTQRAGYKVSGKLKKVEHKVPALSLNKTKDVSELRAWLGEKQGILMPKCDGVTAVVTLHNGLVQVLSRGNGYVGEDITVNAKNFKGIPKEIPYKGELIVRGEAIITYSEFERINSNLDASEEPYKNPRNLTSGTVRALDQNICKEREVIFNAFQIVSIEPDKAEGFTGNPNSFMDQLNYLESLGFNVVERELVDASNLEDTIYKRWEPKIKKSDVPTDGLVVVYDDIEYGLSLGSTGRYPRYGMAFKWKDETQETVLKDVFWSASRTGLLNPVAVFEPVEIEGTMVSRASIHNVSIMNSLKLHKGDRLDVFKSNMIIPAVAKNLDADKEGNLLLPPTICPVCNGTTELRTTKREEGDVITLHCLSKDCPAKNIGKFERFVCRDAMNIEGLSTKTIETLISVGLLSSLKDIFHLKEHEEEITSMEGFGKKSFDNLVVAIEKSRDVTFEAFLYSVGIPLVGRDVCKLLGKAFSGTSEHKFSTFMEKIRMGESFQVIEGIGPIIDENIYNWKSDKAATSEFADVVDEINFIGGSEEIIVSSGISGKTFVITGSVYTYKNRDSLKEFIELRNGKVSGSVSSKTDYLINNDTTSTSGKNKKAKELGIPIISEEEFNKMASV